MSQVGGGAPGWGGGERRDDSLRRRPPSSEEGEAERGFFCSFLFPSSLVCVCTSFLAFNSPSSPGRRRPPGRRGGGPLVGGGGSVCQQQRVRVPVLVGQQDGGHRAAGALEGVPVVEKEGGRVGRAVGGGRMASGARPRRRARAQSHTYTHTTPQHSLGLQPRQPRPLGPVARGGGRRLGAKAVGGEGPHGERGLAGGGHGAWEGVCGTACRSPCTRPAHKTEKKGGMRSRLRRLQKFWFVFSNPSHTHARPSLPTLRCMLSALTRAAMRAVTVSGRGGRGERGRHSHRGGLRRIPETRPPAATRPRFWACSLRPRVTNTTMHVAGVEIWPTNDALAPPPPRQPPAAASNTPPLLSLTPPSSPDLCHRSPRRPGRPPGRGHPPLLHLAPRRGHAGAAPPAPRCVRVCRHRHRRRNLHL